jgi:hypothetical protein
MVKKTEIMAVGIRHTNDMALSIHKRWHYSDKRRLVGRYSSIADSRHGVCFFSGRIKPWGLLSQYRNEYQKQKNNNV